MSQGLKSLVSHLVDQLADAGTWVSRAEFEARQSCSPIALDDALADLIVEGRAEYRQNVGYRLKGTPLCRKALQRMRAEGTAAAVLGAMGEDGYRVGVAERRADIGLVMYELALPLPAPGEDQLANVMNQVGGVMDFVKSRGGSYGSGV